jgi:hypothetical protein
VSSQTEREWWVYSEEDDGQVIEAATAREAVEKWAASKWTDVDDGCGIQAFDLSLVHHFVARQVNEIADDDLTTEPRFEFVHPEARDAA